MKDQFEHILKDKLQDFSLKADPADWARIERSLALEKPRRMTLYTRIAAAAAILVLAVLPFVLQKPADLEPSAPLISDVLPEKTVTPAIPEPMSDQPIEKVIEAVRQFKDVIDRSNGRIADQLPAVLGQDRIPPGEVPDALPGTAGTTQAYEPGDVVNPNRGDARNNTRDNTRSNSGGNTYYAHNTPVVASRLSRTPNSNWALALFADGSAASSNGSKLPGNEPRYMMSAMTDAPLSSGISTEDGYLVDYGYDRASGLLKAEVSSWDHSLPLTFGFTVRKSLPRNWGIETGISYSYLASKASTSSLTVKQKLHYIGVPIAVTYTPLRTHNFDLYGRVGGAADFNLSGRQNVQPIQGNAYTLKNTASGVQWSASANIGIMYNISPVVGIYLEPGVSHYFESSKQPDSYWKEHPTNFNLKIGVRTTF